MKKHQTFCIWVSLRQVRLIQVNIHVGHPADADITPQQVVDSGNLLGSHFIKNKVQRRWLNGACKAQRSFGFNISRQRSKWSNGAFTFIQSATNQKKDGEMKISLTLSYIEKPEQPVAFQLKENDF